MVDDTELQQAIERKAKTAKLAFWPVAQTWHRIPRKTPRSYLPEAEPARNTLIERTIRWLLPWKRDGYPGREQGTLAILSFRVTVHAVHAWSKGKSPLPAWAAIAMADQISARLATGAQLERDLRTHAAKREAEPKHAKGFIRVNPDTGLDGRQRAHD